MSIDKKNLFPITNISKHVIDFLNKIPIFDCLSSDEVQILATHMFFSKYNEGDIVFKEGEKAVYVYFVAYGALDVLKKSETGGQVALATLLKGRSIGEMAIIDEFPRSATVRSRTKSTLILISRQDFNNILNNHTNIGIKILKGISRLLSHNLRKTSSRLADYMLPLS